MRWCCSAERSFPLDAMAAGRNGKDVDEVEGGGRILAARGRGTADCDKFGDVQLHIEWSEPTDVKGRPGSRQQRRAADDRYDQVLDSWGNVTYADARRARSAGRPPLVIRSGPGVAGVRYRV